MMNLINYTTIGHFLYLRVCKSRLIFYVKQPSLINVITHFCKMHHLDFRAFGERGSVKLAKVRVGGGGRARVLLML